MHVVSSYFKDLHVNNPFRTRLASLPVAGRKVVGFWGHRYLFPRGSIYTTIMEFRSQKTPLLWFGGPNYGGVYGPSDCSP